VCERGLPASRIKEAYDRHGDNATAIATGLAKTGRIVTAAAALLAVVPAGDAPPGWYEPTEGGQQ